MKDKNEIKWVRDEILARMGFCNNLINFAIVFAGFVLAGFSGIVSLNLPKSVTLGFLLFSSLALQILNMILAEEELRIVEANRKIAQSIAIANPNVFWNGKFLFLSFSWLLIFAFTILYYYSILQGEPSIPVTTMMLLAGLAILNIVFLIATLILRANMCKVKRASERQVD